jgi:AcrR family transcriptional regulator
MSGNTSREDRRIQRTRDALGNALLSLLAEKPFESIKVEDVLLRAGVARSSFYAHYTGKDDLLLSDAEAFFEGMASLLERAPGGAGRVAPVREFFAHVAEARPFADALLASRHAPDLLALGREHFARAIARRLAARGVGDEAALGQALAGALFALLFRWLHDGTPSSPDAMDALFHRLVPARAV